MPDFEHLIPCAPTNLSREESAAYTERRQACLWLLATRATECAGSEPTAYQLALYRGQVAGRWNSAYVEEAMREHYAQLQAGTRHWLPNDQLSDPRRDYFQADEGYAQRLLTAAYDAWRAAYVPPSLPVFGPHLPGQELAPMATPHLSRAQRAALVDQAVAQLRAEQPPRRSFRPVAASQEPSLFEREVLSSYLAREINLYQARQLLATHGESPEHQVHW